DRDAIEVGVAASRWRHRPLDHRHQHRRVAVVRVHAEIGGLWIHVAEQDRDRAGAAAGFDRENGPALALREAMRGRRAHYAGGGRSGSHAGIARKERESGCIMAMVEITAKDFDVEIALAY